MWCEASIYHNISIIFSPSGAPVVRNTYFNREAKAILAGPSSSEVWNCLNYAILLKNKMHFEVKKNEF